MKNKLITVIGFILAVFLTCPSFAGDACSELFTPVQVSKSALLKPISNQISSIVQKATMLTQRVESSVRVITAPKKLRLRSVRDQCEGTCWLEAGLLNYEYLAASVRDDVPELSSAYMVAQHLRSQALNYVSAGPDPEYPEINLRGRDSAVFRRLIAVSGVVPATEFKVDRPDWDYITQVLSLSASKVRAEVEQIEGFDDAISDKIRKEILERFEKNIDEFLEAKVGAFPKKFVVNGREWTPLTYQSHLSQRLGKTVLVKRGWPFGTLERKSWFELEAVRESDDAILNRIKESLEKKRTLYCSLKWAGNLEEVGRGYLILGSSNSRESMHKSHAVVIVGIRTRDRSEELILQNSWSDKRGDKGFYYITPDAFYEALNYLEVMVTTGSEQNMIDQEERDSIRRKSRDSGAP